MSCLSVSNPVSYILEIDTSFKFVKSDSHWIWRMLTPLKSTPQSPHRAHHSTWTSFPTFLVAAVEVATTTNCIFSIFSESHPRSNHHLHFCRSSPKHSKTTFLTSKMKECTRSSWMCLHRDLDVSRWAITTCKGFFRQTLVAFGKTNSTTMILDVGRRRSNAQFFSDHLRGRAPPRKSSSPTSLFLEKGLHFLKALLILIANMASDCQGKERMKNSSSM